MKVIKLLVLNIIITVGHYTLFNLYGSGRVSGQFVSPGSISGSGFFFSNYWVWLYPDFTLELYKNLLSHDVSSSRPIL